MSTNIPDGGSLQSPSTETQAAAALERLLARAAELEQTLASLRQLEQTLPSLLAIATDFVDDSVRRAGRRGIDVDQRMQGLGGILVKLTEPQNLTALETLIGRLPDVARLAELADQVPGLLAIATDVFDEWAQQLAADGIDLETAVRRSLWAVLYLGNRIEEDELERLGMLLRSDVLDEHAVEVVGLVGQSLARCQRESCHIPSPQRAGALALLRALFEARTQRSLGFALRFLKCFGDSLDRCDSTTDNSPSHQSSSNH